MSRKIAFVLLPMVLVVSGLLAVVAGSYAQSPDVFAATEVSRNETRLTLYTTDQALVYDERTFTLAEGLNRVAFVGVSQELANGNAPVSLQSPTNDDIYVVDKSFEVARTALGFSFQRQLAENIDSSVTLTLTEGDTVEGVLRAADDRELTLEVGEGRYRRILLSEIEEYGLPLMAAPIEAQGPTLVFTVYSPTAGDFVLALRYVTSGLSWRAMYTLAIGADQESVDVNGWLTLVNTTAVAYPNATITLTNENANQVQFVGRDTAFAVPTQTSFAEATPSLPPTGGGGGGRSNLPFTLTLPEPMTVETGTVELDLLGGAALERDNTYVYDGSPRVYGYNTFVTNPTYGITTVTSVQNYLSLSTDALDMPPGLLYLYDFNADGALILAGQTSFPYTPAGEGTEIYLDNAAALSGEREQTAFQQLTDAMIQESFAITLTNDGPTDITVQVPERMTRAAGWEILGATAPYEVVDEFGVLFELVVPAGGQITVDYTVVYRN